MVSLIKSCILRIKWYCITTVNIRVHGDASLGRVPLQFKVDTTILVFLPAMYRWKGGRQAAHNQDAYMITESGAMANVCSVQDNPNCGTHPYHP